MDNIKLSSDTMWHITHAYPCYLEITTPQFQINHTPDPIWRYIWKMNCPPTITLFMWKLTHGILPHRSNLRHRGFQMDTLCPRCQESVEDAEHMLLECDWAQRVWRLSPMGFSFNSGTRLPIREWVCSWLKDSDNDYYKEPYISYGTFGRPGMISSGAIRDLNHTSSLKEHWRNIGCSYARSEKWFHHLVTHIDHIPTTYGPYANHRCHKPHHHRWRIRFSFI